MFRRGRGRSRGEGREPVELVLQGSIPPLCGWEQIRRPRRLSGLCFHTWPLSPSLLQLSVTSTPDSRAGLHIAHGGRGGTWGTTPEAQQAPLAPLCLPLPATALGPLGEGEGHAQPSGGPPQPGSRSAASTLLLNWGFGSPVWHRSGSLRSGVVLCCTAPRKRPNPVPTAWPPPQLVARLPGGFRGHPAQRRVWPPDRSDPPLGSRASPGPESGEDPPGGLQEGHQGWPRGTPGRDCLADSWSPSGRYGGGQGPTPGWRSHWPLALEPPGSDSHWGAFQSTEVGAAPRRT